MLYQEQFTKRQITRQALCDSIHMIPSFTYLTARILLVGL